MQIKTEGSSTKILFKQVGSLMEALVVRKLRNKCRLYLTNHIGYISIPQQIYWYFTYYKQKAKKDKYRIFIARAKNLAVGYGALDRVNGELYVTECVSPENRGKGYGNAILKKMITIAKHEKLPLIAEIRATNKISIGLHEGNGFKRGKTKTKSGLKLYIYRKEN